MLRPDVRGLYRTLAKGGANLYGRMEAQGSHEDSSEIQI